MPPRLPSTKTTITARSGLSSSWCRRMRLSRPRSATHVFARVPLANEIERKAAVGLFSEEEIERLTRWL